MAVVCVYVEILSLLRVLLWFLWWNTAVAKFAFTSDRQQVYMLCSFLTMYTYANLNGCRLHTTAMLCIQFDVHIQLSSDNQVLNQMFHKKHELQCWGVSGVAADGFLELMCQVCFSPSQTEKVIWTRTVYYLQCKCNKYVVS